MHNFNDRQCAACGELSISAKQRFVGGWFFIRCPNCRRLLRVDPQHGERWVLLTAFALIGAASIACALVTDHIVASMAIGAAACGLMYVWEFFLTRRAPLFVVTPAEAKEYRQSWMITAVATVIATCVVAFAVTRF